MQNLAPGTAFILGILAGWVALALLAIGVGLARPWFFALASGSRVTMLHLLGMRVRGTPPMLLIRAYVTFRKRGVDIDLNALEATFMATQPRITSPEELVRVAERTLVQRAG